MYFNKIPHPENFVFADHYDSRRDRVTAGRWQGRLTLRSWGADVFSLTITGRKEWIDDSQAELDLHSFRREPATTTLSMDARGGWVWKNRAGQLLLNSSPRQGFGLCGSAWLWQLERPERARFYGMGEKGFGWERGGLLTKFWNTDVWSDFARSVYEDGIADPQYVSVPWMILATPLGYLGILVNNPHAPFFETGSNRFWDKETAAEGRPTFYLGAEAGLPQLYLIFGPSLAELTRKFQRLVGCTPRPPLWALGHHQCRWGYGTLADLEGLERQFRKHRIPNDGLWLDIEYMDSFQVFTLEAKAFRSRVRRMRQLRARGARVVPILDPGVKKKRGYAVFDDGMREEVFCLTEEGQVFVGFVWPGKSVFPDFSRPEGRSWWAKWVRRFTAYGFSGYWIDMNDPSTGGVDPQAMRFDQGRRPHSAYHNQYALGMAQATHAGLLGARPDERPFVLSRSAYTSSGRYAAVWTGDNHSNWHHLQQVIPVSLNLALSGVPFNGPDVPGFGGNATPELAVAWYKHCFLFPFLRNHSVFGSRRQEPWAFGATITSCLRHYIRMRYRWLPYLYQLFLAQEKVGEAILRPLQYQYPEVAEDGRVAQGEQFLVGAHVMQAPQRSPERKKRRVYLPKGTHDWFSAETGRWCRGGTFSTVRDTLTTTPFFVVGPSVIPLSLNSLGKAGARLSEVAFYFVMKGRIREAMDTTYEFDDGVSFGYQRGEASAVRVGASMVRKGVLEVRITPITGGAGRLKFRLVVPRAVTEIHWVGPARMKRVRLRSCQERWTGRVLSWRTSQTFEMGLDLGASTDSNDSSRG